MEERGRDKVVTSKLRKGAGRGSGGMWGREAGEAAVWMAASPRAAASALKNIMFSWMVAQDKHKPRRLPQPNDSRPVPKPEIPGKRIRRKGSSCPPPPVFGSLPDTHCPPLGLFLQLLAGFPPLPNCTHLPAEFQTARVGKLEAQVL